MAEFCQYGQFLNLNRTYKAPMGNMGVAIVNAYTPFIYATLSHFVEKKARGEITQAEFDRINTQYNLTK